MLIWGRGRSKGVCRCECAAGGSVGCGQAPPSETHDESVQGVWTVDEELPAIVSTREAG